MKTFREYCEERQNEMWYDDPPQEKKPPGILSKMGQRVKGAASGVLDKIAYGVSQSPSLGGPAARAHKVEKMRKKGYFGPAPAQEAPAQAARPEDIDWHHEQEQKQKQAAQ